MTRFCFFLLILLSTMYLSMRIAERLEIVKKRALDFRGYAELMEEASP